MFYKLTDVTGMQFQREICSLTKKMSYVSLSFVIANIFRLLKVGQEKKKQNKTKKKPKKTHTYIRKIREDPN